MVRTTLGAEVDTTVTVSGSESVDFLDLTSSGTVPDGTNEFTVLRPPSGFLYEIVTLRFVAPSTGGAPGDRHVFIIDSESQSIRVLKGEASGDTDLRYQNGVFTAADNIQTPGSDAAQLQAIRGLRISNANGLRIRYGNFSGATQTSDRILKAWVRELRISNT